MIRSNNYGQTIDQYVHVYVQSDLPLLGEILHTKSSHCYTNQCNPEFCVRVKKIPTQILLMFDLVMQSHCIN